jgi:hypothetical protein
VSKEVQRPPRDYLAEAYTARSNAAEIEAAAERATAAAAALTASGHPVRHLRTVFVPEDETSFHFFEANAAEDVAEAVRRADIACERVAEAIVLDSRRGPTKEPART